MCMKNSEFSLCVVYTNAKLNVHIGLNKIICLFMYYRLTNAIRIIMGMQSLCFCLAV